MKYLVVLGDGMADYPLPELGGMTPLEYADIPNMDSIARDGACGLLRTIPDCFEPGSDIANLSVLGYDPRLYYTGRGPLEAMSMGVDLDPGDFAYRCNISTVRNGIMQDFSAGHISTEESQELLGSLSEKIPGIFVRAGVSYRNLLVVHDGKGAETTAPHDIVGQAVELYLPKGGDSNLLLKCIDESVKVFAAHPVNKARAAAGKVPATQIWPWSGGKKPSLPLFRDKYGLGGGMISAVDLLNGIAGYAGMEIIRVPGATGYLDTDYHAKARYAIEALKHLDFLYLHVEAPDEAGHLGSTEEKVKAIERVDKMLGTIMGEFKGIIAVLPDHPTPVRVKTHTRDPVPFAVRGKLHDSCRYYSEREAKSGSYGVMDAVDFLPMLFS
ncbi:MAG TPA: cofactor-independent phosphoglycerate mutase [Methanoregulaceae archaeon]|nr:cofactor-independent phosphoglycerate mutase [Methanoregulaceae archaeon]